MTESPEDDTPCHSSLPERECKLVNRIEKTAQMYDQLSQLIQELADIVNNNDWYFMTHMNQIKNDANNGRKHTEIYLQTLETDSNRYILEIKQIRMLVRRAIEAAPMREIRIIEDDDGALMP